MKNNNHNFQRNLVNKHLLNIILLMLITFFSAPVFSEQSSTTQTGLSKEQKLIAANLVGVSISIAWGLRYWDYGSSKPYIEDDNWFQENSKHGGVDKLGHLYSSYGISHLLYFAYKDWGYSQRKAMLYGAISGFALTTFSEIGDSISSHGFSIQDWEMDFTGAVAAYLLLRYPGAQKLIDIRTQYLPSLASTDRLTDYERIKFLVAFKLSGLKQLNTSLARYLEFHIGYYARGYETEAANPTRNVYAAVGINLSEILRTKTSFNKTAIALNYYQIPYTYIDFKNNLNR